MGLSPLRLGLGTGVAALQLAGTLRKDKLVLAPGDVAPAIRSTGLQRVRASVTMAQLVLGALYAVVLVLYAVSRIRLGLGHHELLQPQYDPKDLVPFGSSALNPFSWLYVPSLFYVMLQGWVIGAVLAPISLVLAFIGSERGRWLAATATATSIVVAVLFLSSFGQDIYVWYLD
ncbi:hypothetical protein [Catellatospora methionotrophica]|uniref:hypothetical protein n=1 Tax=Catellatospora methionotrophica TaxID=121620 RepID=UPI0033E4F80B